MLRRTAQVLLQPAGAFTRAHVLQIQTLGFATGTEHGNEKSSPLGTASHDTKVPSSYDSDADDKHVEGRKKPIAPAAAEDMEKVVPGAEKMMDPSIPDVEDDMFASQASGKPHGDTPVKSTGANNKL